MRPLDLADGGLVLLRCLGERTEFHRQALDFHTERADVIILRAERTAEAIDCWQCFAGVVACLAERRAKASGFRFKLIDSLGGARGRRRQLVEISGAGYCRPAVDLETKGRFGHWLSTLVWEKSVEETRGERTLGDLWLLGLCLLLNLRRHDFAALDVESEDGVELPLFQDEAAKPRPFCYCDKPESIWPVAIAGALRVELLKPEPDLLTGGRHHQLLALMLIDDEPTKPVDQPFVKELRRAAFAST
ncbi:hypothetical protein [Sinorhizobium sp. GL28]|uniref:hypothetical protein n=1 Tax=Sinorhizobium sp. GL28 TaxID=1358418 RepID=UPI001FD99CEA|nr:hypothetical protein [Sinorhizobium sp. GL28]